MTDRPTRTTPARSAPPGLPCACGSAEVSCHCHPDHRRRPAAGRRRRRARGPVGQRPLGMGHPLLTPRRPAIPWSSNRGWCSFPAQAPAFFVPANRPQEVLLTAGYLPDRPGGRQAVSPGRLAGVQRRPGHPLPGARCGGAAWPSAWRAPRPPPRPPAVTFALMTATPAKGLGWPRVRMTKREGEWHATLLSNATQ